MHTLTAIESSPTLHQRTSKTVYSPAKIRIDSHKTRIISCGISRLFLSLPVTSRKSRKNSLICRWTYGLMASVVYRPTCANQPKDTLRPFLNDLPERVYLHHLLTPLCLIGWGPVMTDAWRCFYRLVLSQQSLCFGCNLMNPRPRPQYVGASEDFFLHTCTCIHARRVPSRCKNTL